MDVGGEPFPGVVARSRDDRIVYGRMIGPETILTSSLEIVNVVDARLCDVTELCTFDNPLKHPTDCPVVGYKRTGGSVMGLFRMRSDASRCVEGLDGRTYPLTELAWVEPVLLARYSINYRDIITTNFEEHDLSTMSTEHSVWVVPRTFLDHYVNRWLNV